jgi:hypothetical protein
VFPLSSVERQTVQNRCPLTSGWTVNVAAGARIWEQSKALPSYSSVLTLLWIKERIEIYSDSDEEAGLDELEPEQFTINRRRWPR